MKQKEQDKVIREFVIHLSKTKGIQLVITCWPDKVNRLKEDIDAIAEGSGIQIAIEHTSINTVPKQREDSARFMKVLGGLGAELCIKVTDRIRVTVDFYSVPNKISWSKLRQTLKDWLEKKIPALPNGSDYYDIPGLPFKAHINKQASEKPSFRVARFDPKDETLSERIADSIMRKTQKLVPYKEQGFKTILLIENDDIGLMNPELMISSVKTAMQGNLQLEGIKIEDIVDEIWYSDTSIPDDLEFWPVWPKNNSYL